MASRLSLLLEKLGVPVVDLFKSPIAPVLKLIQKRGAIYLIDSLPRVEFEDIYAAAVARNSRMRTF